MANCAKIKERHLWRRIDQDVKVAVMGVVAMKDGPKDARIASPMRLNNTADAAPVDV